MIIFQYFIFWNCILLFSRKLNIKRKCMLKWWHTYTNNTPEILVQKIRPYIDITMVLNLRGAFEREKRKSDPPPLGRNLERKKIEFGEPLNEENNHKLKTLKIVYRFYRYIYIQENPGSPHPPPSFWKVQAKYELRLSDIPLESTGKVSKIQLETMKSKCQSQHQQAWT